MGASPDAPANGEPKSPTKPKAASPSRQDTGADSKPSNQPLKTEGPAAEPTKPLAPPPKPNQQGNDTPDFFSGPGGGSLSLEPNPFEQSFGGGGNNSGAGAGGGQPETPGGTKLPSVAALTSPSSLLPGTGTTPFNWPGGSLRTGPLSPAMLSGPTNDYFSDTHHIRGGFPTPNESSLRTGLTPGGSGSMFPAPSPNSALLAQLAGSGATPGTLEFHRTALSAAAKRDLQNPAQNHGQPPTSQAPEVTNGIAAPTTKAETKPPSGPFDPHDNDAANGLYMLAQGRNGNHTTHQFAVASQPPTHPLPAPVPPAALNTSPQMASINGGSIGSNSIRGVSEMSGMSEESEQAKPTTRTRGRKNANNGTTTTNGRRKAEDTGAGRTPKKAKANSGAASSVNGGDAHSDEEDNNHHENNKEDGGGTNKSKMTDEEKRKNFLERNRVAALKCRQRKKQWLQNLQTKVEVFSTENENLNTQIAQLREEVVNLKTLLLAHKDCPVTQQQAQAMQQGGVGPIMQVVEPFNQMNPYGMATSMANGAVMGAQPVQRRFS